jgi:hypothetical protein
VAVYEAVAAGLTSPPTPLAVVDESTPLAVVGEAEAPAPLADSNGTESVGSATTATDG